MKIDKIFYVSNQCVHNNIRRASNPMDKGACNFSTSKIQTWPPSTIKSNYKIPLRRCMHEYIMLPATLKQSYGSEVEWYSERIVAQV